VIPRIEDHTAFSHIVCASVFLEGLARLTAWSSSGTQDIRFVIVLSAEWLLPHPIPG
jgi:hypothetical protein